MRLGILAAVARVRYAVHSGRRRSVAGQPFASDVEPRPRLRDDPHVQTARRPRGVFRDALAGVLAVPVIVLVVVASLLSRASSRPRATAGRRPRTSRQAHPGAQALRVVHVVIGIIVIATVSTAPIGARSPTGAASIADEAFQAVPSADPARVERSTVAGVPSTPSAGTGPPTRGVPTVSPSAAPATLEPAPGPEAPAVVRFRPREGWTGVSRFAAVSVRFTRPMDRASTEAAFDVVAEGVPITGTARWAEGDTVLILQPAAALPYGARVTLAVDGGARSEDGLPLRAGASVTFTVQPLSAPAARPLATAAPVPPSTAWSWPLAGPITQRFGESLTQYGVHQGIDIDGETGDPVLAARDGRVVVAGQDDGCGGLEVHLDHGDGLVSWYRHLSRIDVAVGTVVAAGTVIGLVGNTGCSLGSHLHFGIRLGTTFVDPLRYLPPR